MADTHSPEGWPLTREGWLEAGRSVPDGPTRYVTPDEYGVGTNFVGGCPNCNDGLVEIEYRYRTLRHPLRGEWRTQLEQCRFCRGVGTVAYERLADGAFHPVAR